MAAFRDPEGLIGQAYSHFAVELHWDGFQSLLAMIESDRAKLLAYVDGVEAGQMPGPHALTGADPDTSPEQIEADFLGGLDPAAWRRMTFAMGTGSVTDQKLGAAMQAACPPDWTFAGIGGVFLTKEGEPRARMATRSPCDVTCCTRAPMARIRRPSWFQVNSSVAPLSDAAKSRYR